MFNAQLRPGDSGAIRYMVEHRGNCVLIFGEVPLSAFRALTALAPKKAVMDARLSRIAGCSFAMGLPEDTKALIESMADVAIERARVAYGASGISDEAVKWLAVGERGASSDSMFSKLSGVRPRDMKGGEAAYPHDPDDLRRCRLLLEQVPELTPRLGEMATVSTVWAALVARWDEICATMDSECPEWRTSNGRAPETFSMMEECVDAAEKPASAPGSSASGI